MDSMVLGEEMSLLPVSSLRPQPGLTSPGDASCPWIEACPAAPLPKTPRD